MSPLPPIRNKGALMLRSSLCATPFLMLNVASISLKSVFFDLSPVVVDCFMMLSLSLTLRKVPAISIPFTAPSAKLTPAVPLSDFLSAPTEAPVEVTSTFKVPLPLNISLLIASTINGPMSMFCIFSLKLMLGVLRASTFKLPFILP